MPEEVSEEEIKKLEEELKKLPNRDYPKIDYNHGMQLVFNAYPDCLLFVNDDETLLQLRLEKLGQHNNVAVLRKVV